MRIHLHAPIWQIVIPAKATLSSFPRKREASVFCTNAAGSPLSRGRREFLRKPLLMLVGSIKLFHADAHHFAVDRRQRLDLGDRVDNLALDRLMCQQDDIGAVLALG